MSIREQQKADRKKAMLTAATALFKKQGFQKTTMDMIATQAGFGVATLYKYFQTKGGIVRELMQPDTRLMFELGERIIQQPPNDPSDAVVSLVRCCMKFANNWRDKWLLRLVAVPSIPDDRLLTTYVDSVEAKIIEQFRDLLRVLQIRGSVTQGVDAADMASILFAVLNQEYLAYVMHDNMPVEQTIVNIERLIRLLFQPWRTIDSAMQIETPPSADVG